MKLPKNLGFPTIFAIPMRPRLVQLSAVQRRSSATTPDGLRGGVRQEPAAFRELGGGRLRALISDRPARGLGSQHAVLKALSAGALPGVLAADVRTEDGVVRAEFRRRA